MNALGKSLIVATSVVAIALASAGCGPTAQNVGAAQAPTPGPTTASTPAPTPKATAIPMATAIPTATATPEPTLAVITPGESTPLEPGRYAFPSRGSNPEISFTVPSGWTSDGVFVAKHDSQSGGVAPALFTWGFDHGYKDPCTDHTPVMPAAGSGAAALLAVIAGEPGLHAGPIEDATVAGHAGKYVDLTVTGDPATCGNGHDGFWIWGNCPAPVTVGCEDVTGDRFFGVAKGDTDRVYALDFGGKIYTFFTNEPAGVLGVDRAELHRVFDSIRAEPAG